VSGLKQHKRTSRLSIAISAILHSGILLALFFFAAREGILGKQLKKISVTMVPKERPPEKPKEKPPEPKPQVEPPKTERIQQPTVARSEIAKTTPTSATATPPPGVASVAPPPAEVSSVDFDGGKPVESTSDPNILYKSFVEHTLRTHWSRPEGIPDESFVAEVQVGISPDGKIVRTEWKKGSGDDTWDQSVKRALSQTTLLGRKPPKGFPGEVLVRFDVQPVADISLQ